MQMWRKKRGLRLHLTRGLCLVLSFCLIGLGLPLPAGAASAEKQQSQAPSRDDYILFKSVSFTGTNNLTSSYCASGSLAALKTLDGRTAHYELWTQAGEKKNVYGPILFDRDAKSEKVTFNTDKLSNKFGLFEAVINQTLNQVGGGSRVEGTWKEEITLKLLGNYLPHKLTFHFQVQKVNLKPDVPALCIRAYADPFGMKYTGGAPSVIIPIASMYKCVMVYSPKDQRLYQSASEFETCKGAETFLIQTTAYLANKDGQPVYPLLDANDPDVLGLKDNNSAGKASGPVAADWAIQAIKAQEIVSLACATAAERASNPSILAFLSEIFTFDGYWSAIFPKSPSIEGLLEKVGEKYGGDGAKLVASYLAFILAEAIEKGWPSKLAAAAGMGTPILSQLMTAYAVYKLAGKTASFLGKLVSAQLAQLGPGFFGELFRHRNMLQESAGMFNLDGVPIELIPAYLKARGATPAIPDNKFGKVKTSNSWDGGPGSTLGDEIVRNKPGDVPSVGSPTPVKGSSQPAAPVKAHQVAATKPYQSPVAPKPTGQTTFTPIETGTTGTKPVTIQPGAQAQPQVPESLPKSWDGGPGSTMGDEVGGTMPDNAEIPEPKSSEQPGRSQDPTQNGKGQPDQVNKTPEAPEGQPKPTSETQTTEPSTPDQGSTTTEGNQPKTDPSTPKRRPVNRHSYSEPTTDAGTMPSGQTTITPAETSIVGGTPTPIEAAGGQPVSGGGITTVPADKLPPPNPPTVKSAPAAGSSAKVIVPVVLAGGAAIVGVVALAAAAGSKGGGSSGGSSYHCNEGSSWCYGTSTCCPSHWIQSPAGGGGGVWGAYLVNGGCYDLAGAGQKARQGYKVIPCADERKNAGAHL